MSEWASIIIGIMVPMLSALVAGGVAWGVSKARINGLREDVREMKANKYITRDEYEARHSELMDILKALKG